MTYECSCGRQFVNATSLERHQWVTRHQGRVERPEMAVPGSLDPRPEELRQAMELLQQKQAEQQSFDRQRRARRQLENRRNHWKFRLRLALQEALEALDGGADQLHQAGLLALRLLLTLAGLGGVVWIGMNLSRLIS